MAKLDKHLAAEDEHTTGGPHALQAAALPSQTGAMAASSMSLRETVITIEANAPKSIVGSPPVEKNGYAKCQQNISNVADTIKKAVELIALLATTGSNATVNLTPGLANVGWKTAAFSQVTVLSGDLIIWCLLAYSGKPLPQKANFVTNLVSAPVARYINRPQNNEAVIHACQRISPFVNATLSLLAVAIYTLATGAMTIASDVAQYESDQMKRKEEQKSVSPSSSIVGSD